GGAPGGPGPWRGGAPPASSPARSARPPHRPFGGGPRRRSPSRQPDLDPADGGRGDGRAHGRPGAAARDPGSPGGLPAVERRASSDPVRPRRAASHAAGGDPLPDGRRELRLLRGPRGDGGGRRAGGWRGRAGGRRPRTRPVPRRVEPAL